MLYKPSMMSPHMETVDINNIVFKCEAISSTIEGARLMVTDGKAEYYFDLDKGAITTGENTEDGSLTLFGADDADDTSDINTTTITADNSIASSYKISWRQSPINATDGSPTYVCERNLQSDNIDEILHSNRSYTWQMRLYENLTKEDSYVASSKIGWGVIESAPIIYSSDKKTYTSTNSQSEKTAYRLLKIRPHTNMNVDETTSIFTKNKDQRPCEARNDSKAQYYIKVNDKINTIEAYFFHNPTQDLNKGTDLDSYGEPIYGYALIKVTNDTQIDINDEDIGDEYILLCNYIDTDICYFETKQLPKFDLYAIFQDAGAPTLLKGTSIVGKDHPIEIQYSKLHLKGQYSQPEGSSVMNYCISLYENDRMIDTTGEVYSPVITYEFDRFVNGHTYKLTWHVVDSDNVVIDGDAILKVEFTTSPYPVVLKTEYFSDHNSMIIDFSHFISVDAKEYAAGAHEFIKTDTKTGTVSDDAVENACYVYENNRIVYNDDINPTLDFGEYTAYTLLKLDSGLPNTILRIDNNKIEDGLCTVIWDGLYFVVRWFMGGTELRFSPYQAWLNTYRTENGQIAAINEVMKSPVKNYEVPFLYYSELTYSDDNYYHEESIVADHTWLIIIDTGLKAAWFKDMNGTIEGRAVSI